MSHQLVIPKYRKVEAAAEIILTRTHLSRITRDEVSHGTRFVYLTTPHATDSDLRLWHALEAVVSPHHETSPYDLAEHLDDPSKQAVADAVVTLFGLQGAVA